MTSLPPGAWPPPTAEGELERLKLRRELLKRRCELVRTTLALRRRLGLVRANLLRRKLDHVIVLHRIRSRTAELQQSTKPMQVEGRWHESLLTNGKQNTEQKQEGDQNAANCSDYGDTRRTSKRPRKEPRTVDEDEDAGTQGNLHDEKDCDTQIQTVAEEEEERLSPLHFSPVRFEGGSDIDDSEEEEEEEDGCEEAM